MQNHHNIRRIDDATRRTYAWIVQVQRKNRITIKMFSDSNFGGRERALSAAIQYRDALIIAASPAAHNRWRRTIVRRNNRSGIPGVGLYTRRNGMKRWIACWTDENGVSRSKSFSVSIHGDDKAKELAVTERILQLHRLFEIEKLINKNRNDLR